MVSESNVKQDLWKLTKDMKGRQLENEYGET